MLKGGAESSASGIRGKPGLALVGNLGDEVGATGNMGSTVIGHGREVIAFVFRMPMIEVVRCALRQRTLPATVSEFVLITLVQSEIRLYLSVHQ